MKDKKFIAQVLKQNPSMACLDGYFYIDQSAHVLSGFCCESVPSGIYIWKFTFPLFVLSNAIHLTFSERLRYPDGFINKDLCPKSEYAAEFSRQIEPYMKEAVEKMTIEGFINNYAEKTLQEFGYKVRRCYALALILARKFDEACKELNAIIVHLNQRSIDEKCVSECENFLQLMNEDGQLAVDLLMEWETIMMKKLKLHSK